MSTENQTITWLELIKHTQKNDVWVLIDGKVYDVTTYLAEHPGGDDILIKYSGKDATERFNQQNHTPYAISIRDQRIVGVIQQQAPPKEYLDELKALELTRNEFEWSEVAKHNKDDDCWVVYKNDVIDVSQYLMDHPGGPALLQGLGGQDCTFQFEQQGHKPESQNLMLDKKIGVIKPGSIPVNHGSGSSGSNIYFSIGFMIIIAAFLFKQFFMN